MAKTTLLKRDFVLDTLAQRLEQIQQMKVKHLALFGSVARDEANIESDLDFLVEFDAELTFDLYMDLKFFLENLFQQKVDLVIKEDLKPQIKESILKQAIYVT